MLCYLLILFILSIFLPNSTLQQPLLPIPPRSSNKSSSNLRLQASFSNTIILEAPDFYIDVDWTDLHDAIFPKDLYQLGGHMKLALYTNETFLGGLCGTFQDYNCSHYDCFTDQISIRHVAYPYFEFESYILHAPLFVDYTYFFNYQTRFNYALQCSGEYSFGQNHISGIIGMGTKGSGLHNYVFNPYVFSIYFYDHGNKAELSFDCDVGKGTIEQAHLFLNTSRNWEIRVITISLVHPQLTNFLKFYWGTKVIFDLNVDFIGFPTRIYDEIYIMLTQSYQLACGPNNDSSLSLICNYTDDISNLPTIHINSIAIPPELYLEPIKNNQTNHTYKLPFVRLSAQNTTQRHQQITSAYKTFIILGRPFLKYYYVCFEGKSSKNNVRISKRISFKEAPLENWWGFLAIGFVIGIPLVCSCAFFMISCFSKDVPTSQKIERQHILHSRTNEQLLASTPLLPRRNQLTRDTPIRPRGKKVMSSFGAPL